MHLSSRKIRFHRLLARVETSCQVLQSSVGMLEEGTKSDNQIKFRNEILVGFRFAISIDILLSDHATNRVLLCSWHGMLGTPHHDCRSDGSYRDPKQGEGQGAGDVDLIEMVDVEVIAYRGAVVQGEIAQHVEDRAGGWGKAANA